MTTVDNDPLTLTHTYTRTHTTLAQDGRASACFLLSDLSLEATASEQPGLSLHCPLVVGLTTQR